jgi:hypothetical protein
MISDFDSDIAFIIRAFLLFFLMIRLFQRCTKNDKLDYDIYKTINAKEIVYEFDSSQYCK